MYEGFRTWRKLFYLFTPKFYSHEKFPFSFPFFYLFIIYCLIWFRRFSFPIPPRPPGICSPIFTRRNFMGLFSWHCLYPGRIGFRHKQLGKSCGVPFGSFAGHFYLTIHMPNYLNAGDKEMRQMALVNLLKDTAIACFALHIAAGAHHQKLHLEESD